MKSENGCFETGDSVALELSLYFERGRVFNAITPCSCGPKMHEAYIAQPANSGETDLWWCAVFTWY